MAQNGDTRGSSQEEVKKEVSARILGGVKKDINERSQEEKTRREIKWEENDGSQPRKSRRKSI